MDAEITTLPPFESRATPTPDARTQLGTLRAALAHQTRAYIAHNAAGERLRRQLVVLRTDIAALEAELGESDSPGALHAPQGADGTAGRCRDWRCLASAGESWSGWGGHGDVRPGTERRGRVSREGEGTRWSHAGSIPAACSMRSQERRRRV